MINNEKIKHHGGKMMNISQKTEAHARSMGVDFWDKCEAWVFKLVRGGRVMV